MPNDRRWASSIAVAEEPDGYESEYYEDDLVVEEDTRLRVLSTEDEHDDGIEEPEAIGDSKPRKMTKRQKRKQSLAGEVKFLHFRKAGDNEEQAVQELADDFDKLALVHDLSTFKWVSMLEKSLILKLRREEEKAQEEKDQQHPQSAQTQQPKKKGRRKKETKSKRLNDRVRDYWKVALKAAGNKKKVPDDLRDHFLSRMVVGTGESSRDALSISGSGDLVGSPEEHRTDAALLARARDLAVEHPLLWRRYSARERKLRVKKSKTLVQRRAARASERGYALDEATAAAMADNSTALGYYLQHVRIPSLRGVHLEGKTAERREGEALRMQQVLRGKLPESSYRKLIALVQTYVDCFDADDTVTSGEQGIGEPSEETQPRQQQKKQQQKQFRVLLSNLRKTVPQGRIHWIGRDVADFFYVTQPDEASAKQPTDELEGDPIDIDPILQYSEAKWADVRDQYVRSLRNIQKLFLELEREQDRQRNERRKEETDGDAEALDGEDEDPSSERSVLQTFEKVAALTRMDAKRISTQRVKPRTYIPLEALAIGDTWKKPIPDRWFEDNLLNRATIEEAPNESPPGATTSITTEEDKTIISAASTVMFGNDAFPIRPPVDRLVVVDNLPIDMTESRLREAYGRCGDIDALSIVHARPDLDPGKRATDSKKKIRNPSSSSRKQKWVRPRTPLYAMILYGDPGSARTAAGEPLRIFGMVLDQHLMRSHRAADMTTLYLEDVLCDDIPAMEAELNRILGPSDLYVSLDDDGATNLSLRTRIGHRKTGRGRHRKPQLSSYTIRFPSFEAAYWSYRKLSTELDLLAPPSASASATVTPVSPFHGDDPGLHWMETPRDAPLYWTRKLNF